MLSSHCPRTGRAGTAKDNHVDLPERYSKETRYRHYNINLRGTNSKTVVIVVTKVKSEEVVGTVPIKYYGMEV